MYNKKLCKGSRQVKVPQKNIKLDKMKQQVPHNNDAC